MQGHHKGMLKPSSGAKNTNHIVWDQQKLAQDEQYRGIYEKINEPKTPYQEPISDPEIEQGDMLVEESPEEMEIKQHLQKANKNKSKNSGNKPDLNALNAALKKEIQVNGWKECYEEEVDPEAEKKKKRFNEMRDKHYAQEFVRGRMESDDD